MSTPSENFARMVGQDMRGVEDKTRQITPADQTDFVVTDREGAVAFSVTDTGDTVLGDARINAALPGFRVMDLEGMVALEVRADGSVVIPDLVGGGSGGSSPDVEIDTLHVFVLAGQSNMSGRGQPLKGEITPRIKQFGSTRRVIEDAPIRLDMHDNALGTSPGRFFAEQYIATQPARVGVLLVPTAHGGTGFKGSPESPDPGRTWTKGAASDPANALYEKSVAQAVEAIAAAKAAGYHPILKGVLWHQGETNSLTPPAEYQARLDALIADYRADLDDPHLPFILGRMAPEGTDLSADRGLIDQVHVATPSRVPRTGFADATRDGHNPGDTTHFSTLGTRHLGDTYVTGYIQSLGNTHGGY